MNFIATLKKVEPLLYGNFVSVSNIKSLRKSFGSELISSDIEYLMTNFKLEGVNFSLDEEQDESDMGVELGWLSSDQIIDEAINTYPGKLAIKKGYLPIGSCLSGSGDPYFLKKSDNKNVLMLVRIYHDMMSHSKLSNDDIEVVTDLSSFFKNTSIY